MTGLFFLFCICYSSFFQFLVVLYGDRFDFFCVWRIVMGEVVFQFCGLFSFF